MNQPRRVRAKVTRTVTEIAIIELTRSGEFSEYIEHIEELEEHDVEINSIHSVISEHD